MYLPQLYYFLPAEQDFLLVDHATEAKYSFEMTETIKKARDNEGRLLEGITFYITPLVDVDQQMMKSIVAAHGGKVHFFTGPLLSRLTLSVQQLLLQNPTYRAVTSKLNVHIISCEEDCPIWRRITAKGVPIFTKELILTGVLRQYIPWENRDFLVPGSCLDF